MLQPDIDHGARCDRHTGEAWLPRCYDCDAAAAEDAAEREGLRTPPPIDRPREVRSLARAAGRVR